MATLEELADRIERPLTLDIGPLEALTREVEEWDEHPNVNGSCADYLRDLYQAKRFIPKGYCYSICADVNEVRAVVAAHLTERENGFAAVPHGFYAETRALVAAALRARSTQPGDRLGRDD